MAISALMTAINPAPHNNPNTPISPIKKQYEQESRVFRNPEIPDRIAPNLEKGNTSSASKIFAFTSNERIVDCMSLIEAKRKALTSPLFELFVSFSIDAFSAIHSDNCVF